MKLFGSSRDSKHTGGRTRSGAPEPGPAEELPGEAQEVPSPEAPEIPAPEAPEPPEAPAQEKKKMSVKKKLLIVFASIFGVLAAAAVGVVVFYKTQVTPPDVTPSMNLPNRPTTQPTVPDPDGPSAATQPTENPGSEPATEPTETEPPPEELRPEGVYTVLIAARDVVGANTDALMVAKFDTRDYSLNVVSIPRDTLVNVTYRSKKVNAMYAYGGTDGLMEGITDLVGFRPDFYAVIKLNAIRKIVDKIGGVDYYVPQNMDYDDDAQDLHIHFTKGMTHMTGQMAVEYMRYRKGYSDADIGRINAQHEFLTTMIKQVLANKNKIDISAIVDIFFNDVKTSLTTGECGWFAKELLKMDSQNVHFATMPGNYNDYVKGRGYVTVKLDEWLEMINSTINPFNIDVTSLNLDVLYRNEKKKVVPTTGIFADTSWSAGL